VQCSLVFAEGADTSAKPVRTAARASRVAPYGKSN